MKNARAAGGARDGVGQRVAILRHIEIGVAHAGHGGRRARAAASMRLSRRRGRLDVVAVLEDGGLRTRLATAARETVTATYAGPRIGERLRAAYRRLVGTSVSPRA